MSLVKNLGIWHPNCYIKNHPSMYHAWNQDSFHMEEFSRLRLAFCGFASDHPRHLQCTRYVQAYSGAWASPLPAWKWTRRNHSDYQCIQCIKSNLPANRLSNHFAKKEKTGHNSKKISKTHFNQSSWIGGWLGTPFLQLRLSWWSQGDQVIIHLQPTLFGLKLWIQPWTRCQFPFQNDPAQSIPSPPGLQRNINFIHCSLTTPTPCNKAL